MNIWYLLRHRPKNWISAWAMKKSSSKRKLWVLTASKIWNVYLMTATPKIRVQWIRIRTNMTGITSLRSWGTTWGARNMILTSTEGRNLGYRLSTRARSRIWSSQESMPSKISRMMRNVARERLRRLENMSASSLKSMRPKGSRRLMYQECMMISTWTLVLKSMISSWKKLLTELILLRRTIRQSMIQSCWCKA